MRRNFGAKPWFYPLPVLVIEEFPLSLECSLLKVTEDGNIIGQIMNVSADERILGEDGKIDSSLLQAISFDPVQITCS